MQTSPEGRKALTDREGVRRKAYRDSVGVLTIGVGHTSAAGAPKVTPGMMISGAECDAIFARDLVKYEATVNAAVKVPISQSAFDALVSLCYNIGQGGFTKSTVVRRLNAGDKRGAADAFLLWTKAGGRVLPGLVTRRKAEREQFLHGNAPSIPPPPDVPAPEPGQPASAGFFTRLAAILRRSEA